MLQPKNCYTCQKLDTCEDRLICYSATEDYWHYAHYESNEPGMPIQSDDSAEVIHHRALLVEMHDIFRRKNKDYGNSFVSVYNDEGMAAFRIRLSDKLDRFKKLTKTNEQNVKDESIKDTLLDLANYAVMAVICMEADK